MSSQANALIIRQRMHDIRAGLSKHVLEAKQDAQQLTDWKFYIRRYPSLLLPLVSLLAYAIVPKKQATPIQVPSSLLASLTAKRRETVEPTSKPSFFKGIAIAIAGIALRSATSFAIAKATDAVSQFSNNRSMKDEPLPLGSRRS